MVSRGASATNEQIQRINEYLAKNFGQVNVNKATIRRNRQCSRDHSAEQADAIVKYRMDHGDYKSVDDIKKAPGLEYRQARHQKRPRCLLTDAMIHRGRFHACGPDFKLVSYRTEKSVTIVFHCESATISCRASGII